MNLPEIHHYLWSLSSLCKASGRLFNGDNKRALVSKTGVNIVANKIFQKRLQAWLLFAKAIWKDQKANSDHVFLLQRLFDFTGCVFK